MAGLGVRRQRQAGVTLIEMLVVLAVIGVAAGASMLGISAADRSGRARDEAVRLARHLALTVDEALISGRSYGLVWDRSGYRIERWMGPDDGWVVPAEDFAQRHDLPQTLQLGAASGGDPGQSPLVIGPGAIGRGVVFAISGAGSVWQVAFDGFAATPRAVASP